MRPTSPGFSSSCNVQSVQSCAFCFVKAWKVSSKKLCATKLGILTSTSLFGKVSKETQASRELSVADGAYTRGTHIAGIRGANPVLFARMHVKTSLCGERHTAVLALILQSDCCVPLVDSMASVKNGVMDDKLFYNELPLYWESSDEVKPCVTVGSEPLEVQARSP